MKRSRGIILPVAVTALLLVALEPRWGYGQTPPINVRLWDRQNTHVTTRPHNRKLVFHEPSGNLFAFFGTGGEFKDNRYRVSSDGVNWSPARVAISGNGNGSSMDYLLVGDTIYAIFFGSDGSNKLIPDYRITSFTISGEELTRGASYVVVPSATETAYFYGSLTRDASGYFWVGSRRVFQGETGIQTACASRSAHPDDIGEWLPPVEVSPPNNKGNAVPDVVALGGGRLLVVSSLGMNYWMYPNPTGSIHVSLYDPAVGWSPSYSLGQCSNNIRPVAEYDAASDRVHLLYGDTNGDLRHRILESPHSRENWTAAPGERVGKGIDDGSGPEFDASFGMDRGTQPASLWAAYLQRGRYVLRCYDGHVWKATEMALSPTGSTAQNEVSMLRDVTHHIGMLFIDDKYVTYGEVFPERPTYNPSLTPTATPLQGNTPPPLPTPSQTPARDRSGDLNGDARIDYADLLILMDAMHQPRVVRQGQSFH